MCIDARKVYPHVPAAFINALSEGGTKAEAIQYLQETWNELQHVRKELKECQTRYSDTK